ncbi:MAG: DUF4911 domain-containing protein [Desulfosarcina sp.]
MKTTMRCYRVAHDRIGFFQFILEAYDNLAVMSTLDARQALVQIAIAPGCEPVVDHILESLSGKVDLTRVDSPCSVASAAQPQHRSAGDRRQPVGGTKENDCFDDI